MEQQRNLKSFARRKYNHSLTKDKNRFKKKAKHQQRSLPFSSVTPSTSDDIIIIINNNNNNNNITVFEIH